MKLSAWRVALRIARRDALRAKGRSALVVAMVALPVLGVTGADVVFRSAELTPTEHAARVMGQAAAELSMIERGSSVKQAPDPDQGLIIQNPRNTAKDGEAPQYTAAQQRSLKTEPAELARQLLPAGATLVPEREGPYTAASSTEGLLSTRVSEADLTDPVWNGRVVQLKGRAPASEHEAAVTTEFLTRSGLKIGDRTAVRGLESDPFTITGVYEYPGALTAIELIARPGALIDRLPKSPAAGGPGDSGTADGGGEPTSWLVKLPAGAVLDWHKVTELNEYGFKLTSRAVLIDPPARGDVPYYVQQDQHQGPDTGYFDRTYIVILATVAGMALLEIVLLAGPAFAVGARRSRRQLGLLAAAGGDRSSVRAVVLGGGIVLGITGAVIGLGLGVGLVALLRTQAEEHSGRRFGHFALQPLDLLGILLVGLVTGLLAAVVPAVQASRQDVVAALTGRDSLKPPSRKLAVLGLLMLGGGAALALLGATSGFGNRSLAVLGGSALAELGMVALTPYLVGLFGRLGRWLSLGPRLALRDSVRHRGRTAPAVAAVMAAVAGSVAVGVYTSSSEEQYRREYVASGPSGAVMLGSSWLTGADSKLIPQMRTAVERSIPDLGPRADVQRVNYKGDCSDIGSCGYIAVDRPKEDRCPALDDDREFGPGEVDRILESDPRCHADTRRRTPYGQLMAGDATLLHNLYGVTDPAPGRALAAGKAVVFDARYVKDGKVAIQYTEPYNPNAGGANKKPVRTEIAVDAVLADPVLPAPGQAVISPDTAARLGFTTAPTGSVWLPAAMPSDGANQKADGALAKITDNSVLTIERGYQSDADLVTLGLTVFAALVALGAAGIATGLAAADSQHDLTTLAAVGAEPRIRRSLSGFQCGVIAAMGALLGVVCGIVPGMALRKVEGAASTYPGMSPEEIANKALVVFPWPTIAATVVLLPVLAAGLAALLTRSRISLLRRSG
ncbi:FtsX-like permease family protein [Kitasatospora sp. SUK 42]|uniref:FtsX-like permease family protein n=1 Tax=Kitasatospora sp. SUK 42 TaxID=1588882 RepID=UPI0018CA4A4E|nr:ABC transporter permease [Kitasatospora sp. SUK 42]MBV2152117.1 FtsX-like permease family protein [Kitasatospora sp. SUK 42]